MRKLSRFLSLVFILFAGISAFGQEAPAGYNPFVPPNLDDTSKVVSVPVVESSYHRYWIKGDPNYKDTSTYVWYVENGQFGSYDTINDSWSAIAAQQLGKGYFIELEAERIGNTKNASQVWVRWDDGNGGDSTGYVAVYERSSENCIVPDQITGFKHKIILPPEVWFDVGEREECADQLYSVTIMFNNLFDFAFPYTLSYSYPGSDGVPIAETLQVKSFSELDPGLTLTLDLIAVHDLDVTYDETYTVSLDKLRDKYGSWGLIAPLGPPTQYGKVTLTIHHLPQTGGMTMD